MTLAEYWDSLNASLDRFKRSHANPSFSSPEDKAAYARQLNALEIMSIDGPAILAAWPHQKLGLGTKLENAVKAALGDGENPSPTVCGSMSKALAESVYLPHLKRYATVEFSGAEMALGGSIIHKKRTQAAQDAASLSQQIATYSLSSPTESSSADYMDQQSASPVSEKGGSSVAHAESFLVSPSPTAEESHSPHDPTEKSPLFFFMVLFSNSEPMYTNAKSLRDILDPERIHQNTEDAINTAPFTEEAKTALKAYQKNAEAFATYKKGWGSYLFEGPRKPEAPHEALKKVLTTEYLQLFKKDFETKVVTFEKGLADFLKRQKTGASTEALIKLVENIMASIQEEKKLGDSFTPEKLHDLLIITGNICQEERLNTSKSRAENFLAFERLLKQYADEVIPYYEAGESLSVQLSINARILS